MLKQKITKAVIPAAGFGTRFLPWTKAVPKEMLPIVDKPVIQIVVEELVEAGIEEIIFVVNPYKQAIKDHFSSFRELEELLFKGGKEKELHEVERLNKLARFQYVEQIKLGKGGTGAAILSAEKLVGHKPFLVLWGDDFIVSQPSRTRQLLTTFAKYPGTIFSCVKKTDPESGKKYGFAKGKEVKKGLLRAESLIEKPGVGKQPSPYAIVSGFIFLPSIFANLKTAFKRIKGERELYYVDGVMETIDKEPAYALEIQNGRYYDTGNKLEYLKTNIDFGLKDPQFGKDFKKYLQKFCC